MKTVAENCTPRISVTPQISAKLPEPLVGLVPLLIVGGGENRHIVGDQKILEDGE